MVVEVTFRDCEPDVREIVGGWLATTPTEHAYRIGVVGQSPDEARRRFGFAWEAWKDLHEQVERNRPVNQPSE